MKKFFYKNGGDRFNGRAVQVMTIAGSDSDGSAGMQADMHTFFTRSVYGVSVMTACVAGNSYGIGASVTLPSAFIDKEFDFDRRGLSNTCS